MSSFMLTKLSFNKSIFIAVLFKLLIFLFFLRYSSNNDKESFKIYGWGTDSHGYIETIDNLIEKGTYYFERNNYAGRMPGFMPVYYPLRLIFEKEVARSLTIIFQLVFSALSIVLLSKALFILTNSTLAYYLLLISLSMNTFLVSYDTLLYSESISVSTLFMSIYFLVKFSASNKSRYIFFSGIFMTWCVFMKPYMGIILFSYLLVLVYYLLKNKIKSIFKLCVLYLLPFIIIDSIWIIRNYKFEHKIVPLQSSISAGGEVNELVTVWFKFIKIIGGDLVQWNKGSHASWFATDVYLNKMGFERPNINIFPKFIFTKELPRDSLIAARNYLWLYLDSNNTDKVKLDNKEKWIRILNGYIKHTKSNHPFYYYIGNKFLIMKNMIFHKYTYYVPYEYSNANLIEKIIKIFIMFFNIMIVILGFIGAMYSVILFRKNIFWALFSLPVILVIILICFIFMASEYRYFFIPFVFLNFYSIILINIFLKNDKHSI